MAVGEDSKVILSVRVTRETRAALERRASRDGTSISAQVNIALARYLRSLGKEVKK